MVCCCVFFIMIGEFFCMVYVFFLCKKNRYKGNNGDIKEFLFVGYVLVSV